MTDFNIEKLCLKCSDKLIDHLIDVYKADDENERDIVEISCIKCDCFKTF